MKSEPLICLVDDSDDYRLLVQYCVRKYFPVYQLQSFSSGYEFITALSTLNQAPDLLLLDRHMPKLDGHQTLLHVRHHATFGLIPVVMMSAEASVLEINGGYRAGANSFLIKPLGPNDLLQRLTAVFHYWLELNQVS